VDDSAKKLPYRIGAGLAAGLLLCAEASGQVPSKDLPELTSAAQVRALGSNEALKPYSVRFEAVIMYFLPGQRGVYVHDGTAGIYLYMGEEETRKLPLSLIGQRMAIQGLSHRGPFAPQVRGLDMKSARPRILGPGKMPEPLVIDSAQTIQPALHCQWVEMPVLIRKAQRDAERFVLDVSAPGAEFQAVLPIGAAERIDSSKLEFRSARLRGVYVARYNPQRDFIGFFLAIPSPECIVIAPDDAAGVFAGRPQSIPSLLRFATLSRRRALVHGVVTAVIPGEGIFLSQSEESIWAASRQSIALEPGDLVAAAGIPVRGAHRASLEDAALRKLGPGPPPEPVALDPEELSKPARDGALVSIEAKLIEEFAQSKRRLLLLQSGARTFTAERIASSPPDAGAPRLALGSLVRVIGIARMATLPESQDAAGPAFRILFRDDADLALIRPPPWWTLRRALWALGIATAAGLAALAWSLVLRHRVRQQTAIIEARIGRERIAEERSRIARELHDTLQQDLAGLSMQIDLVETRLPRTAHAARETLRIARAIVERSQEEARRSVWDLRPLELVEGDLGSAFRQTLEPLGDSGGPRVEVRVEGCAARLPGPAETHLLRIAQEAVTNALKHAAATRIEVQLSVQGDHIALRVADDGCGFDPASKRAVPGAHFGLLSMRERANKLGAILQVRSAPGSGAEILVEAPLALAEIHPPSAT
jgi:signal transduction histidine kinase